MHTPKGERRNWSLRHDWIHNSARECRNAECAAHKVPFRTSLYNCPTCHRALYPAWRGKR